MFKYLFLSFIPTILFAQCVVGVIGDSISIPYPIMPAYGYHTILAKEYNWRVVNYSVGGSKTDTLMPRLKRMIESDKPQILIIALGVNDAIFTLPIKKIYQNLCDAIEYAIYEDIHVLLGTIDISALKVSGPIYCDQFKSIFEEIKIKYPEIEIFEFLTVEMTSNSNFYYGEYKYHPNELGHARIAANIRKILSNSGR